MSDHYENGKRKSIEDEAAAAEKKIKQEKIENAVKKIKPETSGKKSKLENIEIVDLVDSPEKSKINAVFDLTENDCDLESQFNLEVFFEEKMKKERIETVSLHEDCNEKSQ